MFVIDHATNNDLLFPKTHARGAVPRDFSVQPADMFSSPDSVKLIPRSEWDARIDEQEAQQSSLEHMAKRAGLEVLDQNGQGYCWAYSVTMSVMLRRLAAGQPVKRLSAHAVACIIKNFRDQGGWCGLSQEFISGKAKEKYGGKYGVPDVDHWKEKSMSPSNNTPETWANAAEYAIEQDVVDIEHQVWDRNLSVDLVATLLLQNIPVPTDWNFWSHSVCGARFVRIERGVYGIKFPNSWTPSWGERGWGTINLSAKGGPDGAVATVGITG